MCEESYGKVQECVHTAQFLARKLSDIFVQVLSKKFLHCVFVCSTILIYKQRTQHSASKQNLVLCLCRVRKCTLKTQQCVRITAPAIIKEVIYMKLKGKPVFPIARPKPYCAVSYKGITYAFFAHDDTYCACPLTGELILRHQPREYYINHIKELLSQYPDLKPVYLG